MEKKAENGKKEGKRGRKKAKKEEKKGGKGGKWGKREKKGVKEKEGGKKGGKGGKKVPALVLSEILNMNQGSEERDEFHLSAPASFLSQIP